jgi:hypothetical protein
MISQVIEETKNIVIPKMYSCRLDGPYNKVVEILSRYQEKRNQLILGLSDLLKGTSKRDKKPRLLVLKDNPEGITNSLYHVDDGPVSLLIQYDTFGNIILDYEISRDGLSFMTGSEFTLRVFPSSRGRQLIDKTDGLMKKLDFIEESHISKKNLQYL